MIFWGVNLPQIPDEEVDMDVDKSPVQDNHPPYDAPMDDKSYKPSYTPSYEEQKMSDDFMNRAVVQPKQEDF
eukprot:CAMPEP_0205831108 /NCGR_PEP_ID=MMETSP0206-20130828/43102_1 /ASSEMBLY_ACC=CAM_ASM_000279 /TAXON_ID=36767 /ORGANISM="Euplotes focardii, Strain TN1" /LENGTH=71 /DNA_ID=CAMNT_0053135423 /DNA_START=909 /DNA_END=1124 /DNA_ORIENTATION=-